MVSTPDKNTRPVSAPIMSPISPGDAAPSPVVPSASRTDRKETSTPTGRPRSTERKSEMKAETHVTDSSKTHSTKGEGTPDIKVQYSINIKLLKAICFVLEPRIYFPVLRFPVLTMYIQLNINNFICKQLNN